jgi:hypothetical protein
VAVAVLGAVALGVGVDDFGGVLLAVSVTAMVGVISGTAILQAVSSSPNSKTTSRNLTCASLLHQL